MIDELYAQKRELDFALRLIGHMDDFDYLAIAERAIRERRSKLTHERSLEEFDRRLAEGTM